MAHLLVSVVTRAPQRKGKRHAASFESQSPFVIVQAHVKSRGESRNDMLHFKQGEVCGHATVHSGTIGQKSEFVAPFDPTPTGANERGQGPQGPR